MEVVAAEVAGDVDDFSDEVEAEDLLALQGLGGEFGGVDASGRNFGFFVTFGAVGFEWPVVELVFELLDGGVGPAGWIGEVD